MRTSYARSSPDGNVVIRYKSLADTKLLYAFLVLCRMQTDCLRTPSASPLRQMSCCVHSIWQDNHEAHCYHHRSGAANSAGKSASTAITCCDKYDCKCPSLKPCEERKVLQGPSCASALEDSSACGMCKISCNTCNFQKAKKWPNFVKWGMENQR